MNAQSEIKKGRKYDQVIDGAAAVFMRDGFEGASVDDIARQSGVSKATLYSYFSDKKLLFMAVAQNEICRQTNINLDDEEMTLPPKQVLTDIGQAFTAFLLSPFGLSIMRVVIAESARFPEVGQSFFDNGPKLMEDRMVTYFERAEARGELSVPDKVQAAHQFLELCKANCFLGKLVGFKPEISEDERLYIVDEAVAMFLARYGT